MPRLVEGLSRFVGRVEILARGLDGERRAAEAALARGMPLEAREHARTIVGELPDSPLGLALWADAAEEVWLDHEVVEALAALVKWVPWRADVWLRLGRAGLRTEWPRAREALERAAVAPDERESARQALLDLTDLDLRAGDPVRAQRWLDRIAASLTGAVDRDVALRRAEIALARGDADVAREAAKGFGEDPLDGRAALVRARLALAEGDTTAAVDGALRAYLLDAPEAEEQLAAIVAGSHDVVLVSRVRTIVAGHGDADAPAWAAAFAFAEGRRDDARRALSRGVALGDERAAATLLGLVAEARDVTALRALAARKTTALPETLAAVARAADLVDAGKDVEALDLLDRAHGEWAADLRREIFRRWIPAATGDAAPRPAAWANVLGELRRAARATDRVDATLALEKLALERERPLRVAVVGEFNAGKSTFLNALLGEDVAPTGVLPTTATLHWVAWAPDPFVRVIVRGAPDRVVPHADLKRTLTALAAAGEKVERVFIYAPIELLKRVEILDTPGFNAPDPDHIAAARSAFEEAHVAIWLLDATHAMKETERKVLAEVEGLGVPVQMLANKSDRLRPEELAQVLAHVGEGLRASGLTSFADPVAFSARQALAGKLGDEAALSASNWGAVEALFAERIVDASDALRERALRRKALRVAEDLAKVADERAGADREAARADEQRAQALKASAARLRKERVDVARGIAKGLESARRGLAADLKPLGELPEERQRGDAGLREYVRERFVARLSEPVLAELARAAGIATPPRASAAVRSVLLGAVAAHDAPASLADRPLEPVFEAAVEAFAAALVAEAEQPVQDSASAVVEQRTEALRDALAAAAAVARGPR